MNFSLQFNPSHTVADIQLQFNQAFQFLRLEFYGQSHAAYEHPAEQSHLAGETTLATLLPALSESKSLDFTDEMSVAEFEKKLKTDLGLNGQVFRKSHGHWLPTTATDNWTLKKQNEVGNPSWGYETETKPEYDLEDRE